MCVKHMYYNILPCSIILVDGDDSCVLCFVAHTFMFLLCFLHSVCSCHSSPALAVVVAASLGA